MSKATTYNQDFLLWTQQQAEYLKKGRAYANTIDALVETQLKKLKNRWKIFPLNLHLQLSRFLTQSS